MFGGITEICAQIFGDNPVGMGSCAFLQDFGQPFPLVDAESLCPPLWINLCTGKKFCRLGRGNMQA